MNQIVQFGKRYGKWIAAGIVTTVVAVGSFAAYKAYNDEDDYIVPDDETPEDADAEQTEEV